MHAFCVKVIIDEEPKLRENFLPISLRTLPCLQSKLQFGKNEIKLLFLNRKKSFASNSFLNEI